MRKRAQTRKQVNRDDMWITLPSKASVETVEVAEATARTEQPTYEEAWYQVLRKRDDEPKSPEPETVVDVGPQPEPSSQVESPELEERLEPEPEPEPEPETEPEPSTMELAAVPLRPDMAPQVASSLD